MKINLEEFKKSTNPYGIPYAEMTKEKRVIVDIPVEHGNRQVEVEGIIIKNLWISQGVGPTSQIKLIKQNTLQDKYIFTKNDIYAVYPEKIKKILN